MRMSESHHEPCGGIHGQITPARRYCAALELESPKPDGRRPRRTATSPEDNQGRWRISHARPDLGRPLGQPFPPPGAADAVSVPEGTARRRLYRARLCAYRVRGRLRPDPGTARLHRRPYRRAHHPAARPDPGRPRLHHARPAFELFLADRERRAARHRQQRLPSGRLRDPVGAYGRSADGARVFDPHLCRLPRRRGRARDHGRADYAGRRVRRAGRGRRGRCGGGAAAPDRGHPGCRRDAWPGCRHPSAEAEHPHAGAAGVLAGGFLADRTQRHGQVAAVCFGINTALVLLIAMVTLPPVLLTAAMTVAGFLSGVIAPSRDMLVRAAAPPGAAGRAFGIVSTGFNFSGIASPLLFGWIMDRNLPHWVFT